MSRNSVNFLLWALFVVAYSELEPVPPSPLLIQSATGRPRGGAHPPAPPPPDCGNVRCPSGSSCEMVVEPCRSPPCSSPIPECRPIVLSPPSVAATASPRKTSTTTFLKTPSTAPPIRPSTPPTQPAKPLAEPSTPPVRRQPEQVPPSVPSQKSTAVMGRSPPSNSLSRPQQKGVSTSALLPIRNTAEVKPPPPPSASIQLGVSFAKSRSSNAAPRSSSSSSRKSSLPSRVTSTSASIPSSSGRSSTATCSGVVCPFGSVCHVIDGTPQCGFATAIESSSSARLTTVSSPINRNSAQSTPSPRRPPNATCSGVVCPVGSSCHIVDGTPQCGFTDPFSVRRAPSNGPCSNVKCPTGTMCQAVNVGSKLQAQCFAEAAQLRCPRNESWRSCSSLCEPTCEQRNPKCSQKCGAPRCQCDPGFFRNRSGICKSRSQC